MPDKPHTLRVTRALGHPTNGGFFCEGPSRWRQGRDDRPGKSMEEARGEDRNLLNATLRLDGVDHGHELRGACAALTPCLQGGCNRCNLARQRIVVDATRHYLHDLREPLAMVTVIATRSTADLADLADLMLFEQIRRRLDAVLDKFPGLRVIGGLEISINVAANDWHRPRIVEHGHLIVPRHIAERLRARLKREFPATRGIRRPVRIEDFDGSRRGIAYTIKNRTMRRVDIGRDVEGTPRTRWKPLRCRERVDLARAQDRAGLDACTFARGLRLVLRDGLMRLDRTDARG